MYHPLCVERFNRRTGSFYWPIWCWCCVLSCYWWA